MVKKTRIADDGTIDEYDDAQELGFERSEELFPGDEDLLLDETEEDEDLIPSVLYKGVSRPKTEEDWRQLLIDAGKEAIPPYQMSEGYREGDLIAHDRFGFGVVSKVISPRKMEVIFETSKKLMAMNVQPPNKEEEPGKTKY